MNPENQKRWFEHRHLVTFGDTNIVNYRDVLMVKGRYNPKLKLPAIPLCDCSGIVEAVGDGVIGISTGDRVVSISCPAWIDGPFRRFFTTQFLPIGVMVSQRNAWHWTLTLWLQFRQLWILLRPQLCRWPHSRRGVRLQPRQPEGWSDCFTPWHRRGVGFRATNGESDGRESHHHKQQR